MSGDDNRASIDQYIEKCRDEFHRILHDIQKSKQKYIYHYTNDAGLKGIIETGQIWFTDIRHMNDPSELKYGLKIAEEVIKNVARDYADPLIKIINDFEDEGRYFICSFSLAADDLTQWRAYADNGRGYVLKFDRKSIEELFIRTSSEKRPSVGKIIYDKDKYVGYIEKIIDVFKNTSEEFNKLTKNNFSKYKHKNYKRKLEILLGAIFLLLRLQFKHQAYNNENEYRFIQLIVGSKAPLDMKQRVRASTLIPYHEFDWRALAPDSLKSIRIGPAANKGKARDFIKECLKEFHLPESLIKINYSNIPYRA